MLGRGNWLKKTGEPVRQLLVVRDWFYSISCLSIAPLCPPEIKELIQLIRHGRLFEVQQWFKEGKPYRLPKEGFFIHSPMIAAVESGFHSMIELLLLHLGKEEDLNHHLKRAVWSRRLDLIQLLCKFGADARSVTFDEAASTGNPVILRWFEDQGIDLETDEPIAEAFRWKRRGALGTYMRWKKRLPSLQHQADVALRFHTKSGCLRWVALLLWAGANPRAVVADMESEPAEWFMGTAVEDAFLHGHVEIVKKFKIDPQKDDIHRLLAGTWLTGNKELVTMLLSYGADPNRGGEESAVRQYVSALEHQLEPGGLWSPRFDAVEILRLLANSGGRWRPDSTYRYTWLRRSLAKAHDDLAIQSLSRLVEAGLFEQDVFKQLMGTPRMKKLLACSAPGVVGLRKFAGLKETNPLIRFSGTKRRKNRTTAS